MRTSHILGATLALALIPSALAQTSRVTVRGSVFSIVSNGDQGGAFENAALGDAVSLQVTISSTPASSFPHADFLEYEIRPSSTVLSVGGATAGIAPTLDPSYLMIGDDHSGYGDVLAASGRIDGFPGTSMQVVFIDQSNQQWSTDEIAAINGLDFGPGTIESYFQVYSAAGSVNFTIDSIEFDARLGDQYCASGLNSTGVVGELAGYGSSLTSRNDLTVTASSLPPASVGFFLISQSQGQVANPGAASARSACRGPSGATWAPAKSASQGRRERSRSTST